METKERNILKLAAIQTFFSVVIDGILYPIETLKNRIMNNRTEYLNFKKGLVKYYKQDGIKSFYNGWSIVIPSNILAVFSWVYIYEHSNRITYKLIDRNIKKEKNKNNLKTFVPMFTSGIAELLTTVLYIPLDIVKIRMQVENNKNYGTLINSFKEIYSKEGIKRFYSITHLSLGLAIMRTSAFMLNYENLRKYVLKVSKKEKLSLTQSTFVSCFSVFLNSIMFNPIEVVMVRFQTTDSTKIELKARHIFKELLANERFFALYKGFVLRVFLNCTYSIVFFHAYEYNRHKYGFQL